MDAKQKKQIKSEPLRRSVSIMELVATSENGLTMTEITAALNLPKATVYRLVKGLVDTGLLNGASKRSPYVLGERFYRIYAYNIKKQDLQYVVTPLLRPLAKSLGVTVWLARYNSRDVEIAVIVYPQSEKMIINPGEEFPPHASAGGKVLFSQQPESVIEKVCSSALEKYQANTITDVAELKAHYEQVRNQGFAVHDEEMEAGVFSIACPVPQKGGCIFALGVDFLSSRLQSDLTQSKVLNELLPLAEKLSSVMSSSSFYTR